MLLPAEHLWQVALGSVAKEAIHALDFATEMHEAVRAEETNEKEGQ